MFKKKNNLQTAIAIACMTASFAASAAVPAKPNVVTIMIDDMGFSDIGMFGGEINTPNLDAMIKGGTQFTKYYSAPTSSPARAMFFTGRDSHPAGLGNMAGLAKDRPPQKGMPGYEGVMSKNLPTFPELLQQNGYYTTMAGKWHLGEEPGYFPSERGFTNSLALLPGGDIHFLSDANGKIISALPLNVPGAVSPYYHTNLGQPGDLVSPYRKDDKVFTNFPANAFSTDFYTEEALKMVENRPDKTKPFYMHLSHIASHGPFQAPKYLIDKYYPIYLSKGLDVLRAERFAKLKSLGLVPQNAVMPPLPPEVKPWSQLTADQKKIEAKRMAIYAGLVEKLDQSVGTVIKRIKAMGPDVYANTVFLVMSDNGGALHEPEDPNWKKFLDANFHRDTIAELAYMGSSSSFISPSGYTGALSNMPFNRFKAETFEGGLHTAAFVYSPASATASRGVKYDCLTSVMDMSATILNLTGTAYPTTYNTKPLAPIEGKSFAQILNGDLTCKTPNRSLGIELNGAKMLIQGDWKLSQKQFSGRERWDSKLYLFNLANDPFELHPLNEAYPSMFNTMWSKYAAFAQKNHIIDVGPRTFARNGNLGLQPARATGMILGGTQINYDISLHVPAVPQASGPGIPTVDAPKMGDTVDIAAEIYPPTADKGLAGNVMVAAYYKPATGAGKWTAFKRSYDMFGNIISSSVPLTQTVDGSTSSPNFSTVPNFSAPLASFPSRIELPIYEGKLVTRASSSVLPSFAVGTYYFWIGYKLSNGTMEHSALPVVVNVTP